ncbi:MAG: transcriptional regulator [Planctomycetales bacterium]|nr:transcriptional regulator [Planctomycetales bacterium]
MTSRVDPTISKLPKDMQDLAAAVAALPVEHRENVESLFQQVADSTRRRQRILSLVQEALSQLRLDMKYLLFDLEATRRERDEYRDALDQGGDEE